MVLCALLRTVDNIMKQDVRACTILCVPSEGRTTGGRPQSAVLSARPSHEEGGANAERFAPVISPGRSHTTGSPSSASFGGGGRALGGAALAVRAAVAPGEVRGCARPVPERRSAV